MEICNICNNWNKKHKSILQIKQRNFASRFTSMLSRLRCEANKKQSKRNLVFIAMVAKTINIFFSLLLHFRHGRVASLNALLVTLLPGSVGLCLHLLGSPEPNSSFRSRHPLVSLTVLCQFYLFCNH